MPPRAFDQAVVKRQRHDIEAEVGRALHVAVAAEDVGAACRSRRHYRSRAEAMQNARTLAVPTVCWVAPMHQISVDGFSVANIFATRSSCAPGTPRDALDFFRRVFFDFLADVVHAVDALLDELLVLPAILEDVPEHARRSPECRCPDAGAHIPSHARRCGSGADR